MPRPVGRRNKGFDKKRDKLVRDLTEFALNADLRRPSLRQFAQQAGVSEPTLRHYFGDRQAVVRAILEDIARRGAVLWEALAAPSKSVDAALGDYFRVAEMGMAHGGFIRTHAFGLVEGLADPELGQAYLELIFEPSLKVIADKLRASGAGDVSDGELRTAAFAVFSPLVMMSLHQDLLGGKGQAPTDLSAAMKTLQTWIGGAVAKA